MRVGFGSGVARRLRLMFVRRLGSIFLYQRINNNNKEKPTRGKGWAKPCSHAMVVHVHMTETLFHGILLSKSIWRRIDVPFIFIARRTHTAAPVQTTSQEPTLEWKYWINKWYRSWRSELIPSNDQWIRSSLWSVWCLPILCKTETK